MFVVVGKEGTSKLGLVFDTEGATILCPANVFIWNLHFQSKYFQNIGRLNELPVSGFSTIFHNFARNAGTFAAVGGGTIISTRGIAATNYVDADIVDDNDFNKFWNKIKTDYIDYCHMSVSHLYKHNIFTKTHIYTCQNGFDKIVHVSN